MIELTGGLLRDLGNRASCIVRIALQTRVIEFTRVERHIGVQEYNMTVKGIIGSTVELVIKIVVLVFFASYLIKAATAAYDYGYRIFTEAPVSLGEGRIISVSVEDPVSVRAVGEMLEERGLIRDANLFVIQELLSESHGKIQPGIYDLSTAMTAEEMMAVMAQDAPDEEETQEVAQ